MARIRVLIAAAGGGTRAGLPYPKTLHTVLGKPILVRLVELMRAIDPVPVVVVSPTGRAAIADCLHEQGLDAVLIEQEQPTGMGDAILRFRALEEHADHLLVVWGDIPLIGRRTVAAMCVTHLAHDNDLTFVTRVVDQAYTLVERDSKNSVQAVIETRESGTMPGAGERDIGLFIFRPDPVLNLLERRLSGWSGRTTGEHGFLYIIRHLVDEGHKVEALPIATDHDLISLNRLSDLDELSALQDEVSGRKPA